MSEQHKHASPGGSDAAVTQEQRVELARLQPIEAEVIAARLRAAGIDVTLGPTSVYGSFDFTEGVSVLVFESDAAAASALLEGEDHSPEQQA